MAAKTVSDRTANVMNFPRRPLKPSRQPKREHAASTVIPFPKEKKLAYDRDRLVRQYKNQMYRTLLDAANKVWDGEFTGMTLLLSRGDFYESSEFIGSGLFAQDRDSLIEYLGDLVEWMEDGCDLEYQRRHQTTPI